MSTFTRKFLLLAGVVAVAFLSTAKADQWNQKTVFTFSGPVDIPGQTLPAGTYVFKLANTQASRHVVQVFSKDERRIFGTFLAIPDYHLRVSDKPIIKFHERPAGEPDAIKAWFYPGRNYGHEFVYPKTKALVLAKANNEPVPAMPTELAADTTKSTATLDSPEVMELTKAPLMAEKPSGEEVEVATLFMVHAYHGPNAYARLPETLPKTATLLPLIAFAGLFSLALSAVFRLNASRSK